MLTMSESMACTRVECSTLRRDMSLSATHKAAKMNRFSGIEEEREEEEVEEEEGEEEEGEEEEVRGKVKVGKKKKCN